MLSLRFSHVLSCTVLVLLPLFVQTARAQTPGSPVFKEELAKQANIYSSKGQDVPEGYVIGRSLLSYTVSLPSEFHRSLAALGPKDRWLDIGAGEGRAILDYCNSKYDVMLRGGEASGQKAQAVAMSIEDRRTRYWEQTAASLEANQIQYLFGKSLREYSLDELGKFQVITDVLGGFSYAQYLSLFMEKTLGFLEVGGSFYTLLQDVRSESGENRPFYPDASFLTEILKTDGSQVGMCSWLKSIGCVEVTCEFKPDWTPHVEVYRIHKVCDKVTVPSLRPIHFEAGTPPERRYQLTSPIPTALKQSSATR